MVEIEKGVAASRANFVEIADQIKRGKKGIIPAYIYGMRASEMLTQLEFMVRDAIIEKGYVERMRAKTAEIAKTHAVFVEHKRRPGFSNLQILVARVAMKLHGGEAAADRIYSKIGEIAYLAATASMRKKD